MTPQEELLILELQTKWGNRWSRIAGKLPGRTDNEIKNYWRTHMRKMAQERKHALSLSSPTSNSPSSSSISSVTNGDSSERSFYDTGGIDHGVVVPKAPTKETQEMKENSMDEIWREIASSENGNISALCDGYGEQGSHSFSSLTMAPSPIWDYYPDSLWNMESKESNEIPPIIISDQLFEGYDQQGNNVYLTG